MRSSRGAKEFLFLPAPSQLPSAVSLRGSEVTTARLDGGGPDRTTLVCGFLGLDAAPFNPLLAALPRVLHVSGSTLGADSWVASFLRAAVVESNHRRPGGEAVLERMSAELEQTEAGLQHATHLFEGEGKVLGVRLADLLAKHQRVLEAPETAGVTREFAAVSRSVHAAYANRIVGF